MQFGRIQYTERVSYSNLKTKSPENDRFPRMDVVSLICPKHTIVLNFLRCEDLADDYRFQLMPSFKPKATGLTLLV